ncbi:MAG: Nif11-like leader peptide family RiPP precursor [Vulcanococcus sp.]
MLNTIKSYLYSWGLKALLETVKSDVSLQEKLKASRSAQDVVAAAKSAGLSTSVEELRLAFWFHSQIERSWDESGWWGFDKEVH